jgi:dipeptidyl aminopeptidase/acylaminoacyl peptidase
LTCGRAEFDILRHRAQIESFKVKAAAMKLRACPGIFIFVVALLLRAGALAQDRPAPTPANPAAGAAPRNLTVDDYFRIKEVADAQISPEGKWVAYTVKTHRQKEDDSVARIWMVSTSAGGDAIPLTADASCSSRPRWSPDGKYLAFLRERGECEGEKEIWIMSREGGEPEQLTHTAEEVKDFAWSPAGDRLVLVMQDADPEDVEAKRHKGPGASKDDSPPRPWVIDRLHFKEDEIGYLDRRRTHLYVFTIAGRQSVQITSGDYDDTKPAWSPDGRSIAFVSNRSENPDSNYNTNIWVVAANNTDRGKNLVHVSANPGTDDSPAWSADGKWIAFTSQLEPRLIERATIHVAIAPAAGGDAKILTRALDRSVYEPRFSADGKYIYFMAEDDGTENLLQIPAAGGEITRPIAGRRRVDSFSVSETGAIAAIVGELARPDEVYLLPPRGDLRRLTTTNDGVMSQIRLGTAEYVHFKSKDGTPVAGYIFEPPDPSPAKKSPAILWLHGGPVGEYFAEFDFRAWLLAANGYVVVMPNPRGSSGYGQEFCAATYADWGNKDYDDDIAAVDFAIAQGLADPDRLGVGGHSYGAIATNWIITKSNRFKAAISNAGEFMNITNYGHDEYSIDWEIELGLPWENRALWEKLSPFNSVTNIQTPTLVIGGDEDWNCPIINGEQLYQSLKRRGVPTLLVVYPGESHEFDRPSFVKDYYQRYLAWYGHYVKGEGPAIPPSSKPGG